MWGTFHFEMTVKLLHSKLFTKEHNTVSRPDGNAMIQYIYMIIHNKLRIIVVHSKTHEQIMLNVLKLNFGVYSQHCILQLNNELTRKRLVSNMFLYE